MGSLQIIPKYYPLLIESSQIVSILLACGCLIGIIFFFDWGKKFKILRI